MYFVDKKNKNKFRELNSQERLLLKNADNFSEDQKENFAKFLQEIKNQYWIECDCSPAEALLVIYSSKYKVLIRCKVRNLHKSSCGFYLKNVEFALKNKGKVLLPTKSIRQFNFYSANQIFSTQSSSCISKERNFVPTTKLGQALYTFCTDSKCNQITFFNDKGIYDQLKDFTNAVCASCNKVSDKLTLEKIYRYTLNPSSLEQAKKLLQQNIFPQHLKPFVLFGTRIKAIKNNQFEFIYLDNNKNRTIENFVVESGIKKPSEWISFEKSAPFFLLATYIHEEDSKKYILKDAFAMPIYKWDNMMPVESFYERQVLDLIVALILQEPNKKDYIIEKPLFGSRTNSGEIYRPDFIIERKDSDLKIFIEVLGSNNAEYLEHKKIINDRASGYCSSYLSIKGFNLQAERESFIRKFRDILRSS